jgi:WD40 repeat protein
VSRTGQGAPAPLASLAHYKSHYVHDPFQHLDIYAGGWDKSITKYSFTYAPESKAGRTVTAQSNWKAHNDFVKCLLVAQTADKKPILVSGGADGEVNFWTIPENKRIATLKPQARGIEYLALDPYSDQAGPIIFISTSQREIFTVSVPELGMISSSSIQSTLSPPALVHETSVYKLHFDVAGDLWTASADKTAKRLVRDNAWQPDTVLQHPDFVRDVVTHDRLPYVITACRDEEIRVWNSSTGDLYHIFSGHYEEVTGLAVSNNILVSISIDATLRRWSLDPADLRAEVEKAKNPHLLEENPEPNVDQEMSMLTEEEEAELKAMMEQEVGPLVTR